MILEIVRLGSGTYGRIGNGEAFAQWLSRDETPDYSHPQGRRWGVWRAASGTTLYLGRLVVTMSRRTTTRGAKAAIT